MEYKELTEKVMECAYEVKLVNYLVAIGKLVGLILNFEGRTVGIKRKIKELSE